YITWNGKTEPLTVAGLRKDKRVYPHQTSSRIHQRPSTISRTDGSVRLNKDPRIVFGRLTYRRAHDTHADRIIHPYWAAKSKHKFTLFEIPRAGLEPALQKRAPSKPAKPDGGFYDAMAFRHNSSKLHRQRALSHARAAADQAARGADLR